MAELRIAKFNDDLMLRLKTAAVMSRTTIKDYLEKLVAEALTINCDSKHGKGRQ
jgi:hypothetical protein